MTPQQIKALLDSGVLQAYAEGKPVQFYDEGWGKWCDPEHPYQTPTTLSNEWRVKPEKKTGWIAISKSGWVTPICSSQLCALGNIARTNHSLDACIQIEYYEGEGL